MSALDVSEVASPLRSLPPLGCWKSALVDLFFENAASCEACASLRGGVAADPRDPASCDQIDHPWRCGFGRCASRSWIDRSFSGFKLEQLPEPDARHPSPTELVNPRKSLTYVIALMLPRSRCLCPDPRRRRRGPALAVCQHPARTSQVHRPNQKAVQSRARGLRIHG